MLARQWKGRTSERRLILWPRAYETIYAKALPVYEALKLCWERLPPCKLHMLAMSAESQMYYWTLPEHIRRACETHERVSRVEALNAMPHARVMLAPSMIDGVPNAMYEAMAAGAFPIVSPLPTIRPVVEDEQNVLFARNLYPEEIAAALVRAMTDDALVDAAAIRNLELVRRVANRAEIRARVVKFYEELADGT
jgi:glycosyltransferase involved in cell wall biosynthesis